MAAELPLRERSTEPVGLTIGSYDGVHRGHRALLRRLQAEARRRSARTAAITFDPHPRCVVDPRGCPPLLTTPSERADLLHGAGIDQVVVLAFNEALSRWSAERFCDALLAGRVGEANAMLGRVYTLAGSVVAGNHIGARLGYPTANLAPDAGRCVPGVGVYAGWLEVDRRWLPAAISVGTRPTVTEDGALAVEAHVLDFEGDLYGRATRLAFLRRLRGERRFAGVGELREAIAGDVVRARSLLAAAGPPA
ncbi:MAG TPA: riboflavin kinase [Candidatus Dormibacteraeota bacterium]|nr:riboflavin kinase [Candidatus Dormibacteraeota bacterium]